MSIWNKLKHFNPNENWGDKNKVNGLLLLLLDSITEDVKQYSWAKYKKISPCIIHCAYESSGHCDNSQHYKGNAADFHFENIPLKQAYEVMLTVLKEHQAENFVGLGIYPDWIKSGFHLDVRGEKARWSRIGGVYKRIEDGLSCV
jgi:uncharacterized protein YcbK (DUF882 family)